MARSVIRGYQPAKIRVVGIFVPLIIVAKILPGVVRRVCKYKIYLPSVLIKTDESLKIFAFDQHILTLLFLASY